MNIDLNKYKDFVEAVTSKASNDLTTFHDRLDDLNTVSYTHLTLPTNREV